MKPIFITKLCVAILLLGTLTNYGQSTFTIGDFKIYRSETIDEKIILTDTCTFFDSVLYYRYSGESKLLRFIHHVDTGEQELKETFSRRKKNGFDEILRIYENPADTVLTENRYYKYGAELGDKWTYLISFNPDSSDTNTIWAEVVDVFQGYQFGEWRTIKRVKYYDEFIDYHRYFCDDFGELSEEQYTGIVSYLRGCYLDGIAYGDTSFGLVAVEEAPVPDEYNLQQNYPNPFNPSTKISFRLQETGKVTLDIYTVNGEFVKRLINREMIAGYHEINYTPEELTSGVYFYKLNVNGINGGHVFSESKKMIYLK